MPRNRINEQNLQQSSYQAVILDLDGVITQTAHLHAYSWKQMFDRYLQQRSQQGEQYALFDVNADYQYMNGKPRHDGVQSFLESRGIKLAKGSSDDLAGTETIYGLGNLKNELFLKLLEQDGIRTYADTVEQIYRWQNQGMKLAVVSSSRNCDPILKAAGLRSLFEVKVDGVDCAQLRLKGKPAPDLFLEAARQLNVEPQQAIVIEDAISGVAAGRAGGFGLVVGVDRDGSEVALQEHGADLVVQDLRDLHAYKVS